MRNERRQRTDRRNLLGREFSLASSWLCSSISRCCLALFEYSKCLPRVLRVCSRSSATDLAPGNPGFILDAFALTAIDHAHDTAPLLGFCNHHFDGIGGGAKNATHFRNIF